MVPLPVHTSPFLCHKYPPIEFFSFFIHPFIYMAKETRAFHPFKIQTRGFLSYPLSTRSLVQRLYFFCSQGTIPDGHFIDRKICRDVIVLLTNHEMIFAGRDRGARLIGRSPSRRLGSFPSVSPAVCGSVQVTAENVTITIDNHNNMHPVFIDAVQVLFADLLQSFRTVTMRAEYEIFKDSISCI